MLARLPRSRPRPRCPDRLSPRRPATRFEPREPSARGRQHSGAVARDSVRGWAVRHDRGSPYLLNRFQKDLAFSASTVRQPSSAPRQAMAAPSASSARCRRTCGGADCRDPRKSSDGCRSVPPNLKQHLPDWTPRVPQPG